MGAFETYLQMLNQRTQMEAEQYARQQMANAQLVESIFQGGKQIAQAFQEDRQLKGQYQNAWKQAGAPMLDENLKTPTDQRYENIKAKLDAIRSGMTAQIDTGTKPQKMSNIEKLDKRIQEYNVELERLNKELSDIETYRQSPEYAIEKENAGFDKWIGSAPVGSGQYYEIMQGGQPRDKLEEFEAKEKIKAEVKREYSPKATQRGIQPQNALDNVRELKKQYDNINKDIMLDDSDRISQLENIRNSMIELSNLGGISQADRVTIKGLIPQKIEPPKVSDEKHKKESWNEKRKREKKEAEERANKATEALLNKYTK